MKKTGKFLAGVACMAMCCSAAFLIGCGGSSDGNGGKVENLNSEQVTEMNGAVSTTKNYKGSYTINETATTVAGAYYDGEVMEEQTQESTAVVSYDYEGKKFLYYANIPQGTVSIYNEKNADGSWTQYLQSGYTKYGNKYSHQKALVEDGFTIENFKGESVSLHFNSLSTAVKSLFYADLNEAAQITDPAEYSDFWSDSYQTLANQLMSAYNVTASYKNGGSSVETEGESIAYAFEIIGTPNGTPTLSTPEGNFKLKNYKLTMDITLVVTDGLIDEIRCEVKQTFKVTQSGATVEFIATSNVVDDFIYAYDGTKAPTADALATYTVNDMTNGVVGDPDEDKEVE